MHAIVEPDYVQQPLTPNPFIFISFLLMTFSGGASGKCCSHSKQISSFCSFYCSLKNGIAYHKY